MKRFYFLLMFIGLAGWGFGQGLEDFTNSNATSSYSDNNFVGQDGITWYYIQSRDANGDANGSGISLPALMLRRSASNSKVYSETISGGIGNFSVKLYKGFTGAGNRQVELFINDVSYGTSAPFDDFDEHIFTVNNINISGDIVIRIDDITSKQVIVDDISWTEFSSSGPDNPTDFLATTISTSEIDLSWTRNGDLDEVMLVWSPDNSFGTPVDGNSYAAGDTIPGGDSVLYVGVDTTFAHNSLAQGTQYYYKAFSLDGSTTYSSGVTDDAATYKDEPSNHVTSFAVGIPGPLSIPLTWSDNDGTIIADSFLIMINTTGVFTAPVDGTLQADDLDVSDGEGVVNVVHGAEEYTWNGLSQSTHYYFTIYPYTNTGSAVDYKTDGTIPTCDTITTTANTGLIISEVSDPGDYYKGRFVELYNISSDTIFLSDDNWYLTKQSNGNGFNDIELTGTIPPGEAYIVAYSQSYFNSAYGFNPSQSNISISGNGDDGYYLYYGGKHDVGTLIDAYGVIDEDGTGKAWEYEDSKAVRKRSVSSPNATWTASEWVITDADVVNMTPGQHFNDVTWQGTTDNNWDTKTNWDNGFIPDASMNVTIPAAATPEISTSSYAQCWDLDVAGSATLSIASGSGAQGALVVWGTPSGNVKVSCFVTTGRWHGISTPVSGQTGNSFYLGGNPNVWAKYYNEDNNTYTYISSLSTPLGDMKGWMVWIDSLSGTLSDTLLTFEGTPRSGVLSPSESIVRTHTGADYGYNFIGNPYTSTIDWDDSTGWTKTNIDTAIYTYNDGNWATYANGIGTNGGSRYIAMNQGFFVQVKDDGSTSATLVATNEVQVKHSSSFLKNARTSGENSLLRLEVSANGKTDETVIKLQDGATEGFDSQYDAHKLFSFNTDRAQIFSTANGKMSINTLPLETGYIDMDVTGKEGDLMTISLTERENMEEVWMEDNLTGIQTNLVEKDYSFTYDNTVTDRFTLFFNVVNVPENNDKESIFNIYSSDNILKVVVLDNTKAVIEVYNLLGQKVQMQKGHSGINSIELQGSQYYIVKVYSANTVETQKVLIR